MAGEVVNELPDSVARTEQDVFCAQVASRVDEARQRIEHAKASAGASQQVRIVAVTKTHGVSAVLAAFAAGVADVGENRVQEALGKMALVSVPVRWHLIGHLQRNKARSSVEFALVHSIDGMRLASAVNEAAEDAGKVQPVLVQVNVTAEESKGGISPFDVSEFSDALQRCRGLRVEGVMTMAPLDASERVLRNVFSQARATRDRLLADGHPALLLSMGMSGDFEVAVEEGATLVRLGTVLFGHRA